MNLMICPGCAESFEANERTVVWEGKEAKMEHFWSPDGRLFCCDDCFVANG